MVWQLAALAGGLLLYWLVFNVLARYLGIEISNAAALTLEQRRNTLRADVIDSYYGALRSQERLDLAQRSLALAERGLVVANGRVTACKTSPVEATRAQVQLSEIRLELNRAQMGLTDAYRPPHSRASPLPHMDLHWPDDQR